MVIDELDDDKLWISYNWTQFLNTADLNTPRKISTTEENNPTLHPADHFSLTSMNPDSYDKRKNVKPAFNSQTEKTITIKDTKLSQPNPTIADVGSNSKSVNNGGMGTNQIPATIPETTPVLNLTKSQRVLHEQAESLAQHVEALTLENESLRRLLKQNNQQQSRQSKLKKVASSDSISQGTCTMQDSDLVNMMLVQARALEKCLDNF